MIFIFSLYCPFSQDSAAVPVGPQDFPFLELRLQGQFRGKSGGKSVGKCAGPIESGPWLLKRFSLAEEQEKP